MPQKVVAAVAATSFLVLLNTIIAKKTSSSTTGNSAAFTGNRNKASLSAIKSFFYSDKKKFNCYLLVGDIGGTNTRLALHEVSHATTDSKKPVYSQQYLNSEYLTDVTKTFEEEMFIPFLQDAAKTKKVTFEDTEIVACFAVAGPVENNSALLTNLGNIKLDGTNIESFNDGLLSHITKCKIINDFVGQGYGLLDLDFDAEVIELIPNSKNLIDEKGPKACLGAGTGLGECYLTTSSLHPDEGYECYGSEGGHVDYAPRSKLQHRLLEYLQKKFNQSHRLSIERIVSGKGLANVYEFLSKEFPSKVNKTIQMEFDEAGDMQGRVVGMNANKELNPCELCVQAMEIMIEAYGSEAGNCAMKFIPTGGLYVTGGLTPKNINFIRGDNSPFMKAYNDKGRMSTLVKNIPLFAVMVEDIGLRGARVCAMREYQSLNNK